MRYLRLCLLRSRTQRVQQRTSLGEREVQHCRSIQTVLQFRPSSEYLTVLSVLQSSKPFTVFVMYKHFTVLTVLKTFNTSGLSLNNYRSVSVQNVLLFRQSSKCLYCSCHIHIFWQCSKLDFSGRTQTSLLFLP